jgi:adenylate cyclase
MPVDVPPDPADNAFWEAYLRSGHRAERAARRVFRFLPHGPRCKLCAAPFAGVGAIPMRMIGKHPSDKNPAMCSSCFTFVAKHHGGAEIDGSFVFADVRGSTSLAESMSPQAFHGLLDRYYTTATELVFSRDGFVDKFVGDELVAMFTPILAGDRHADRAVDTGLALLRATGHDEPGGPWLPIGIGIHTGRVWYGAVGEGSHVEVTALGDVVNTTARLASVAAAGELLITIEAATAAGLDPELPRRLLELKGKGAPVEVVSLRAVAVAV